MLASVASATLLGVDGTSSAWRSTSRRGFRRSRSFGLPDAIVRESRERARAALLSSKLPWPRHRITVNLRNAQCEVKMTFDPDRRRSWAVTLSR